MSLRIACESLVFPVVMLLSIVGAHWGIEQGYSIAIWGFVVTVANLATIGLIEQILPMRDGVNVFRDRQSWNDIGHGILLTTVGRPLGANLAVLAGAAVTGGASDAVVCEQALWPSTWPIAIQVLLGLMIYSFADYWKHRVYHKFDFLWWIHAVHHDTQQMHVLKAGRLHLLEGTIRFIIVSAPLMLLGAPSEVFIWVGLWMNFEGNLNHSNVQQRFPSWFHYLIPTVQIHHIHHARERRLQDSNFAGVTPLWDVLFGTFSHPDDHVVDAFGIADDPVPTNFFQQLLFPFRKWMTPKPTASYVEERG